MRAIAAFVLMLALAAPAGAQPGAERQQRRHGAANPSAIVAAEIAFARAAREKGQWTAFRETAAPGAEMFVQRRSDAHAWLKGQADPAVAIAWQTHEVVMSCDGTHALATGAWQRESRFGEFLTVWLRQDKSGGYKWLVNQGSDLAQPIEPPEMIAGKIADCAPGAGPVPASPLPAGVDAKEGASPDRTLQWSSWVYPDGALHFFAWAWNGSSFDSVLNLTVPPPVAGK